MLLLALFYSLLVWPAAVLAGFGWSDDGANYVIDSGADLVIKVSKCCGDIVSMQFKGVEYQGYGGKNTQVEIGLGPSEVTIEQMNPVIKVSVTHGTLKHYLVFRYKNNNVYIFTNKKDASITVSRYIVRFPANIFPHSPDDADYYDDGSEWIEASDVMKDSRGFTESKHYAGNTYGRTIDYDYVGKSNGNAGMWMVRSNHEKASGGPGPTVLAFTNGEPPSPNLFARRADWGWFDNLGIEGWVPQSGRGHVTGIGLANMKEGHAYVVGLSNPDAQYWATAGSNGAWSITGVLPGTYTLTVYKSELEVHTSSVTVEAGKGAAVHTITCADPADIPALWRIGEWDGTPKGFLNFADTPMKPTYMHPADSRLAPWDASNYIVGTSTASIFPGYMWVDVNNDHVVYFRLTAEQIASGHQLRIGITEAYIGGRPSVRVNGWTSRVPPATGQGGTRSLTVGTYRGNNAMLTYDVPASAWVQNPSEWQVLTISIVSGSRGSGFLSAGVSFDCLDLV
ncbi:hypothetical protein PG993_014568 [Apiospora rasikravindrae]|uniref:rhamnogalacturonan endolyase n=1 Tax=Apiospora rasikravindrae TaxID=990691 RepID=A0ABR1RN26_9PEZI